MLIGENIYAFRKAKNMTQAELGDVLGVSNQTVSKWETGLSMPDVMLLPEIARALGVTLDALYGIESPKPADRCTCADEFPAAAYDEMLRYFVKSTKPYFTNTGTSVEDRTSGYRAEIDNGKYIGCYSNTEGAFVMNGSFAFIDRTYKADGSEDIFTDSQIASVLGIISDRKLLRVLKCVYKIGFERSRSVNDYTKFYADEIAAACSLPEDETDEYLARLIMLDLIEVYKQKNMKDEYYLRMQNILFVLAIFKSAEMLLKDKFWLLVRDSSMITDYIFES